MSLVGVKFTTSRLAAEAAIDAVCTELGRPKGRCRTGELELPFAGVADVEGRLLESLRALDLSLDRDVLAHLSNWYGTEASDVIRHAREAGLLDRLSPDAPVLTGEIATPSTTRRHGGSATRCCAARLWATPATPAARRSSAPRPSWPRG